MIKLENFEVMGWEHAIRGMRNPKNSWDRMDSCTQGSVWCGEFCSNTECLCETGLKLGPNDLDLMTRLRNAGTDHRKFMRMITVYVDITAPLYWWKEFDTYKVGTVANSCSTMHKIHDKEFTLDDFSHEHMRPRTLKRLMEDIAELNFWRDIYLYGGTVDNGDGTLELFEPRSKEAWWQMIQLLGSNYNQKRTVMLDYEVLANMHKSRKLHKLDEWRIFCVWIGRLPYSGLITGSEKDA